MDEVRIIEAEERYCASFTDTISSVAREGQYLSSNDGFSYESILYFYRNCKALGYPQYYVVNYNDSVVGWCDIVPRETTGRKVGFVGVGLLPEYRERGIGTLLIQHAIDRAKEFGFTELRMECRASNHRALHVYTEKLGFHKIKLMRRTLSLDGQRIPLVYLKKKLD